MSKDKDFNYFKAYAQQAQYAQELALNLQSAYKAGEFGEKYLMTSMHTVENDADQVNHGIQSHLRTDFVVPLERDGMAELARALDDAADAIEDIAINAYIYCANKLEAKGSAMLESLVQGCSELVLAVNDLTDFSKNSAVIQEHLVNVQTCESDCDVLYIESARALYEQADLDGEQRRIAHAMLDVVEDAMDAIENAAEHVETIIALNL